MSCFSPEKLGIRIAKRNFSNANIEVINKRINRLSWLLQKSGAKKSSIWRCWFSERLALLQIKKR